MKRGLYWIGSLAVLLATGSEGRSDDEAVATRSRPEYDAIGIRAGSFMIYPALEGAVGYTDNVYNVNVGEVDDFFYGLGTRLQIDSGWSRHAVDANFKSDSIFYDSESDEDHTNIDAGINGRVDVTSGLNVVVSGTYDRLVEERGSPDLPGFADEPTEYSILGGSVTVNKSFNRMGVSFGGAVDRFNYHDTPLVGGGSFNNDDRDRDVYGLFGKVTYAFSPGYGMFVRGLWNSRDYDSAVDDLGFNRNSDGYEVIGGVQFELTRLLVGDAHAGYISQSYDDPAFRDISGPSFGASLDWYASTLTTVFLEAATTVEETTLPTTSGYAARNVTLGADHELKRNIIISGSGTYAVNDYKGVARNDKIWAAHLGARYLVNRNLEFKFAYNFVNRDTNAFGQDYSTNTVLFSIVGKL